MLARFTLMVYYTNMEQTQEQWKRIVIEPKTNKKYFVSSHGRIKSVCRNGVERILKPAKDKNGYAVVAIGRRQFKTHRIVAKYFCRKREITNEVNHKNGVKSDNRACNLEWVTHSGNQQHRRKVLKHNVCRVVHIPTREQFATLWEAHLKTGVPILEINKSIMSNGVWVWKYHKRVDNE